MQKIKVYVIIIFLIISVSSSYADKASLIFNDQIKIEPYKGKMRLELVRIWGGDDEEDEKKFFRLPSDIVIGKDNTVNIIDRAFHHYKVFDREGKYLRTVGQKGRGPGDMFCPMFMFLSPLGEIGISELGTFRFQLFSPEGKSKKIFKNKKYYNWIGMNSMNQFLLYDRDETLKSKKILSIWNRKFKPVRTIGVMHDKCTNTYLADRHFFALDSLDNVYILNKLVPVIRKYSPEGQLLKVITFESTRKTSIKISLNSTSDEIVRDEPQLKYKDVVVKKGTKGIRINKGSGKRRSAICRSLGVDSKNRIFVIAVVKKLADKDKHKMPGSRGTAESVEVVNGEYVDEIYKDFYRLYVFNPQGEIIATAPYDAPLKKIYMHENRLFFVDDIYKKRIMEYRYHFTE